MYMSYFLEFLGYIAAKKGGALYVYSLVVLRYE